MKYKKYNGLDHKKLKNYKVVFIDNSTKQETITDLILHLYSNEVEQKEKELSTKKTGVKLL